MLKPQVTITLGRSGQKVVRRPQTLLHGERNDFQRLSGSKRSSGERFKNDANSPFFPKNKRPRGDVVTRRRVQNRADDVRLGGNDLRLKLLRKKSSRRKQSEVEEQKKMDLRENMSRTAGSPEQSLLRNILHKRSADEMVQMESVRKSYSSHDVDGLNRDRVFKAPRGISPPRYFDELRRMPSTRPIQDPRTRQILGNGDIDPYRPPHPAPSMVRASISAGNPVMGIGPPSGSVPNISYMGEQPLTVGSLLDSLGLGKYDILFRADEVDMAALKQMGDRDLKELGLPMGPRKKILLAMTPPPKQKPQL